MVSLNREVLYYIIQSAFPGFVTYFFLILFIAADKTFPEKTIHKFVCALSCAFLLLISDSLDFYFQQSQIYPEIWLLIAATGYTLRIASIGFVVAITQRAHTHTSRTIYVLMILNALVAFTSIQTKWLFFLDENTQWQIGPLYFVPYGIICFYGYLLVKSAIQQIRTNPGESIIIFAICIASVFSNILELTHRLYMALSTNIIVCIMFYFLCLNVQLYRRDTLTNLLNRRSFYMDLKRLNRHRLIIASMDLNDLKYYNDTEGHKSGDEALITTVQCMNNAFSSLGKLYRTGGDEFNAIFEDVNIEEIEEAIRIFHDQLSRTRYEVACGYAICYPGDDYEKIIAISDEAMYNNKKRLKEKRARNFDNVEII